MRRRVIPNLSSLSTKADPDAIAKTVDQYRAGKWRRRVIRPLVMTLIVMALMLGIIVLIVTINLDTRWYNLLPFLFLVALESVYTTLWLRRPDQLPLNRSAYRAAEFLFFVILARMVTWSVFAEGIPSLPLVREYLVNPLNFFIKGAFPVTLILTLLTWRIAIIPASTFSRIALSHFEIQFYSLPLSVRKARIDDQPIEIGRNQITNSLMQSWLWGGILLVLCVGLSTIEISSYTQGTSFLDIARTSLTPPLVIAVLIYFLGGFWLLSEARLAALNSQWLLKGVNKQPAIEKNWQRYSLFLIGAVALLATFLPIGSAAPIGRILNFIILVFMYLVQVIFVALMSILFLLLSLLPIPGANPIEEPPPPPPVESLFLQNQQATDAMNETAAFIFSSAFWAIFIFVVIIAILFYVRERGFQFSRAQVGQSWQTFRQWLRDTWANLWLRMNGLHFSISFSARGKDVQKTAADTQKKRRWRFIRVNSLSPRDQIRYFYLSTLRRAKDRGVERQESKTPLEFVDDLKAFWPDTEADVDVLTDAFLKARYSADMIDDEDVLPIKDTWKNVRSKLRKPTKDSGVDAIEKE